MYKRRITLDNPSYRCVRRPRNYSRLVRAECLTRPGVLMSACANTLQVRHPSYSCMASVIQLHPWGVSTTVNSTIGELSRYTFFTALLVSESSTRTTEGQGVAIRVARRYYGLKHFGRSGNSKVCREHHLRTNVFLILIFQRFTFSSECYWIRNRGRTIRSWRCA